LLYLTLVLAAIPASARADPAVEPQNDPVAAGSGPLQVAIVVETLVVEETAGGQEVRRWQPAGRLSAGDEVHYTIRVRNPGRTLVGDVVVTKRLPYGVHYLRGSAAGPACEVQFSVDGGGSFIAPANGTRASRKQPPSDDTHVRWILTKPLAPGATALLRFRATFT
jgi:uncharacterized repeat protein (TIGR01451 family)